MAVRRAAACTATSVAAAFGVPAVGLLRPDQSGQFGKLAAYAATWETPADAAARPVT